MRELSYTNILLHAPGAHSPPLKSRDRWVWKEGTGGGLCDLSRISHRPRGFSVVARWPRFPPYWSSACLLVAESGGIRVHSLRPRWPWQCRSVADTGAVNSTLFRASSTSTLPLGRSPLARSTLQFILRDYTFSLRESDTFHRSTNVVNSKHDQST